jgi:hypothetical protein
MPLGNAPTSVIVGAGAPVVVTVVVKGAPTIEIAELALRIVGGTFSSSTSEPLAGMLVHVERVPP